VNKQPKQLMATAWKPGQSGNPAGRPIGARQKLSEKMLGDLEAVWGAPESDGTGGESTTGREVLRKLAKDDPGKLAQIAYGLLPRDVFISVEQRTPGNLDPDDWATLRRILDIIQASAPAGVEPGKIFETIENALRAEHATLIGVRFRIVVCFQRRLVTPVTTVSGVGFQT
jgi:Family of unknown function (DUF5681)